MNVRFASVLVLVMVVAALGGFAQEGGSASGTAQDEAAIRATIEMLESGWNTKSGSRFAEPFAENADFGNVAGGYVKGRATIEKGHDDIFKGPFRNSTTDLSVKQIRFVRRDVALVHVVGSTRTEQNGKTIDAQGLGLAVMVKDDGVWRIEAMQNTPLRRPGQ